MNKVFKIVYCVLFFALLALPPLVFFGAKETKPHVYGWDPAPQLIPLTYTSYTNRTFQTEFTRFMGIHFFPRKVFLYTAYQLREWMNLGLFHYGYSSSILEGRDGVLYERPYTSFHLNCPHPAGRERYAKVLSTLKTMDAFCRTNGITFVFAPMLDKPQLYPEALPVWFDWFWDYSNYNTQAEVGGYVREEGIEVFDPGPELQRMKREGKFETWVYPPYGTHFNAYGNGLIYNLFLDQYVKTGKLAIKPNRFTGVHSVEKEGHFHDDDIANLLNIWINSRAVRNPHYAADFELTNGTVNAGSVIMVGDCYRYSAMRIMQDAKLFANDKIFPAPRGSEQKPETYKPFVKDLKLVMVVYQSFNTGNIDKREEALAAIFSAIRRAYVE